MEQWLILVLRKCKMCLKYFVVSDTKEVLDNGEDTTEKHMHDTC